MDDAERPIEEVIGWHYDHGWGWIDADDNCRDSATIDDMAAWLQAKRPDYDPSIVHLGRPYRPTPTWIVYTEHDYDGPRGSIGEGPTILAALTAAVRKVDALARSRV